MQTNKTDPQHPLEHFMNIMPHSLQVDARWSSWLRIAAELSKLNRPILTYVNNIFKHDDAATFEMYLLRAFKGRDQIYPDSQTDLFYLSYSLLGDNYTSPMGEAWVENLALQYYDRLKSGCLIAASDPAKLREFFSQKGIAPIRTGPIDIWRKP